MGPLTKSLRRLLAGEIWGGLRTTLGYFFRRPFTVQYPEKQKPLPEGYRGLHSLRRVPSDGAERCVGCGLCARICPARAISMETREGPDRTKIVDRYVLDLSRCIYCGFCVEVCPVEAIVMTTSRPAATVDRRDLVVSKDRLLEPWEGE